MRKFYLQTLAFSLALTSATVLPAQNIFFTDQGANRILPTTGQREIFPGKFRTFSADIRNVRDFLWTLPKESSILSNYKQAPVLRVPMPDGSMARFHVWESSIQAPALQAKFPEIRTFAGQGIDDPYASIRFDYSPEFGFHAQILSFDKGRIFIDPFARGDVNNYISYFIRDYSRNVLLQCGVPENAGGLQRTAVTGPCRGTQLFTYRLAVANTNEYAAAVGGTTPAALHAQIVMAVNRITGVYETELAIRLQLIANNDIIEFTTAEPDPFNGNNNASVLINESQTQITSLIGSANFDIGHTFSTGAGGLAGLGVVCNNSSKARGVTGLSVPLGDVFYIDFVAHEVGHQFGGNHSFNGQVGNCSGGNRNGSTAYEPGSGTTIQAYAGICGSDNIQPNSDPFFHTISFDEISNFVTTGGGSACEVATPTGNQIPVITAMNNNGANIPLSTPFTLTGTATDPDGDPLTYCWEQWDLGPQGAWNSGAFSTTAPNFKSRIPKTTGSRTFPDIAVILANYPPNPPATMGGLKGETLPSVGRAMKFRLTVRDNRTVGGGVVTGGDGCGTFVSQFQINAIAGTGPFIVTVPNGGESYPGGTSQTITWDVAGTNVAPISTSNVNILLSTDGGLTYPITLLANTPNDGTENVTIPGPATTTARIKIEAVGNIFFDISNADFTITAPIGGFTFNSPGPITATCPASDPMSATLTATYNAPFTNNINLSAVSSPAGPSITFGTNPLTQATPSTTVNIINASTLAPGTYTVTVTGNGGTVTQTRDIIFTINPGSGPAITGDPANQTICAGGNTSFTVVSPTATSFKWQVNTGSGFTDISNGGVYSGATTATLVLTNVPVTFNGYLYRAVASAQCGSTNSNPATLTVNSLPAISAHPANAVTCVNGTTSFTATGTGTGIGYQWQVNTGSGFVNVVNGGVYSGATTGTLTITGALASMNGYIYHLVVTGTCPPPATSNNAVLTVINPVVVTVHPTDKDICSGANTTFSITATSTETISYQWQVNTGSGFTDVANGGVYSGATTATLTITGATASMNNYRYRARVNNVTCTGPVFSNEGVLLVRPTPTIGLSASLTALLPGQSSLLTATPNAPGSASSTVTWQYNGAALANTGNTYTANVEQVGNYQTFISATYAGTSVTCSSSSPVVTITATPSTRLFIFPSPNDGRFTVSYFNNGGASTSRTIVIFDSKGSQVYNRIFPITGLYTLINIDLRQAARGIYYVAVGDANGQKLAEGKVHIR